MDHHEAVRKFEHLMLKEADHAREIATELEALAPIQSQALEGRFAQFQFRLGKKSWKREDLHARP